MEHVKTASPVVNYQDIMAEQIRWVFGLLHKYAKFNIQNCNSFNDIITSFICDENIHTLSAQLDELFKTASSIPISVINQGHLIPLKDDKSFIDFGCVDFPRSKYIDKKLSSFNYIQNLLCMIALLKINGFPVSDEISSQIIPLIQNLADLIFVNKSHEVVFWALYETYI